MFPGAAAAAVVVAADDDVDEEPQLKGGSCTLEAHSGGPSASDSLKRPDEGTLKEATAGKQRACTAADIPQERSHACTGRPARPAADAADAVKYVALAACR